MDLEYFVLRFDSPTDLPRHLAEKQDSARPSLRSALRKEMQGFEAHLGAARLTAETHVLSEKQAIEAGRDRANLIAPVMPVALIDPCSSSDFEITAVPDPVSTAIEAKASWGVI